MASKNSSGLGKDGRTRNWSFVLYPESAPEDWREKLDSLHIPWVESPVHEFDVNPDGEVKKAHIHVVMQFRNKKSYEQIKEITDSLNQPRPEPVADMRGICRYLIHKDNPEKHQYDFSDIQCHQGFDVSEYFEASKPERRKLIFDMICYIRDNNVTSFIDFCLICALEHYDDWYPLICDNSAYIIGQVIKSQAEKNSFRGMVKPAGLAAHNPARAAGEDNENNSDNELPL